MIRILIANESDQAAALIGRMLAGDAGLQVVARARDGEEAVRLALLSQPDVVVMGEGLTAASGREAIAEIMERSPRPVVVVCCADNLSSAAVFQALEAGALTLQRIPASAAAPDFAASARELRQMLRLMAEVKVVRRLPRSAAAVSGVAPPAAVIELVALAASTGGPVVLEAVLSQLPVTFPAPLLVVQHMMPGFLAGFAAWLQGKIALPLTLAVDREVALPGHVYLAPEGRQMGINAGGRISLSAGSGGIAPSAAFLFRSVASAYGPRAAGVLLSGMGEDGAAELKLMRQRGALTVAQDQASSAVYGMPGAAAALGAAQYVLPPGRIAGLLLGAVAKEAWR